MIHNCVLVLERKKIKLKKKKAKNFLPTQYTNSIFILFCHIYVYVYNKGGQLLNCSCTATCAFVLFLQFFRSAKQIQGLLNPYFISHLHLVTFFLVVKSISTTMSDNIKLRLHYWNCRGRVQAVRYMLEDIAVMHKNVDYKEDFEKLETASETWVLHKKDEKIAGPFHNLPVLHWNTTDIFGQTLTIGSSKK